MKKLLSIIIGAALFSTAAFAQVSNEVSEKCFKIMEATEDILAYHGDYSATSSWWP